MSGRRCRAGSCSEGAEGGGEGPACVFGELLCCAPPASISGLCVRRTLVHWLPLTAARLLLRAVAGGGGPGAGAAGPGAQLLARQGQVQRQPAGQHDHPGAPPPAAAMHASPVEIHLRSWRRWAAAGVRAQTPPPPTLPSPPLHRCIGAIGGARCRRRTGDQPLWLALLRLGRSAAPLWARGTCRGPGRE